MSRYFNTAGPIRRDDHYFIEPLERIDLEEILRLIDQKKYFVLHAPRQTGKTSLLLALMEYLNALETYKCLYVNVEAAQAARGDIDKGMQAIMSTLADDALDHLGDPFLKENWRAVLDENGALSALKSLLSLWSKQSEKPIVLFLDEVDSLVGDTLISLLRQLRTGYTLRPKGFPQSIILCGVRDVRDYRIHSDMENTIITGGSAFNVKAKSLRMGNLNIDEIKKLYMQHTVETGQVFEDDIFPLVWDLTEGQPWLVNALAYEACFEIKEGRDRGTKITKEIIEEAKENLILRRETHLDQLSDKLKEERVRRVIGPILACASEAQNIPPDDADYVIDLGLIKKEREFRIANRIYKEVIPRELTYTTQLTIHQESSWYVDKDGRLDMDKLLTAFQEFFRKNFEHWVNGFNYNEAGPQLLLQAFLQRVINGGGEVGREYGLGRQRTDVFIRWPYKDGKQEVVIELKLLYGSMETTIEKGLEQTWQYMDKCGAREGYLLIFNRTAGVSWEEKIFKQEKTFKNVNITVYGM